MRQWLKENNIGGKRHNWGDEGRGVVMKKPRNVEPNRSMSDDFSWINGYNTACDDWEKYHKWAMDKLRKRLLPETLKQEILLHQEKAKEQYQQKWDIINGLPSVEEIEEILVGVSKIIPDTVEKYGDYWYWLAKAIHKRIKGEG